MARPYWQRSWIIQELALNQQTVNIVCGSKLVPCSFLVNAAMILRDNIELVYATSQEVFEPNKARNVSRVSEGLIRICVLFGLCLQDLDDVLRGQTLDRIVFKRPDLNRVLRISATSQAGEDKDKFYGILGLVEQRVADSVNPEGGVESTEAIFVDFAKAAALGTGNWTFYLQLRIAHQPMLRTT